MKKIKLKVLLCFFPLFFAALCDPVDDDCTGLEEFQGYDILIENTQAIYNTNETIWLNATVSSTLFNNCSGNEEVVTDSQLFRDSIFIVRLVSSDTDINSENVEVNTNFDLGNPFNFDFCDEAIFIVPVASEDGSEFNYRLGISLEEEGDYCIVSGWGRATTINQDATTNSDIYNAYNNGENTLKFDNCGQIYTRTLDDALYFFSIQ